MKSISHFFARLSRNRSISRCHIMFTKANLQAKLHFSLLICLCICFSSPVLASSLQQLPHLPSGPDSKVRAAIHDGSAPVDPSEPDDEHFVVDKSSGLDTNCLYRNSGPLRFSINIDRYVGEVDGNGFLKDPSTLILNKVISRNAKLLMPAFDVDSDDPGEEGPPEVDKVFFNGMELSKILTGIDSNWVMNEFEIPISMIKFPATRGTPGHKPEPVQNEIRVDIDTANISTNREDWCTAIDWAELQLKAMAPILLIHGINAGPGSWNTPNVTDFLRRLRIPFESEIQLEPNGSIDTNASLLKKIILDQAMSFGVKKVHLVAHSKGGLDSRKYLSTYYDPEQVKVLSLSTLSTPHQGSVIADISMANLNDNDPTSKDDTIRTFLLENSVAAYFDQTPKPPGLADLQTEEMLKFNSLNFFFPYKVKLYTYGADADLDNDGTITDAEAVPLIPPTIAPGSKTPLPSGKIGTVLYHILRDVSSVTVVRRTNLFGLNEWHEIIPKSTTNPQDNDLSVTDTSSQYTSQIQHFGPLDKNHSTIHDQTIIGMVLDKIQTEFPLK